MSDAGYYPSTQDQDRILDEARRSVKKASFFMKKSLDEENLREGLRHARDVLGELRSSQLNPQKYYEMYMQVFDELTHLRVYIAEEQKRGKPFEELYEVVQHAGNVLPRLYLMCTVGCEYIRCKQANARDTLKDLVELCKGVQHPTRGLFLRSYLCQVSRGLLPDSGSEMEGDGGNIHDAMDFLLSNFIEMNKLWVRMQYQGSKFDLEKREDERRMLQDLVGKNLTFLSQLDGLDFNLYSSIVLKRVIDQIVCCEDVIAQQYLMQCIIQCFPDDFHLGTLDDLLGALPQLKAGVKVHLVMSSLIERLAIYAEDHPSAVKEADSFTRFKNTCAQVLEQHSDMHAQEVIDMHKAMLNFTASVHPGRLDYINELLGACYKALKHRASVADSKAESSLVALLSSPLSRYGVVSVLSLDTFPLLMDLMRVRKRKEMAVKIVQAITNSGEKVDNLDNVCKLFTFIGPLIHDVDGAGEEQDEEEVEEEQGLVARVVQCLWAESPTDQMKILVEVGQQLEKGDLKRMKYTMPTLIFAGLRLVKSISTKIANGSHELSSQYADIFDWMLRICALILEIPQPLMALRCFLSCAYAASEQAGLEDVAYDCIEQACVLFEESISSSTEKGTSLSSIIGTLHSCYIFEEDNRAALVQTVSGYCAQMLKKEDQCRAMCMVSQLHWQKKWPEGKTIGQPPVRDTGSVMRSLKRCIKLADGAIRRNEISLRSRKTSTTDPVVLYVELLNKYIYYFEEGNKEITVEVIQQLLDLVSNEMADRKVGQSTVQFYRNTLQHLSFKKKSGDLKEMYAGIELPKISAV